MKPLVCITVLLATAKARGPPLHPALVTSCIAEQLSSGLDNVKTCLQCFEAIEDPLSEEGVTAMKECSGVWLRRDSEECAWELDNLVTGDRQRMEDVISCFTDVRVVINAEQCLERIGAEGEEADVVQDLITGVLCLQESETNVTNILDILNHEKAMAQETSLEQGPSLTEEAMVGNDQLVDEDLADQMGSLVYQRHCNIASASAEDPEQAEAACVECFEAVTHPDQVPRPQEYVASLASCGAKHLAPEYDSCTLLLNELAEGNGTDDRNIGREIFLCFTRVVDMAQIQSCVTEMEIMEETEVTTGSLLDVMVCNERINDKWVVDHININSTMMKIEEEMETTTLQQ